MANSDSDITRQSGPAVWWIKPLIAVCTIGAAAQIGGLFMSFVIGPFAKPGFNVVTVPFGLAGAILGGLSVFVALRFSLLGKGKKDHFSKALSALMLIISVQMGIVATFLAFGKQSPWGNALSGISGPLSDGLTGLIEPHWWPLIFVGGLVTGLLSLSPLVVKLVDGKMVGADE